jgi:membrane protein
MAGIGAVASKGDRFSRRVWNQVSHSPLHSLWDFQGVSKMEVAKRSYRSFLEDNLLSRAAELGYFFLFALFPMLLSATAILGLVARGATAIYSHLLEYLAIVIPHSSLATILVTFKETTNAATSGKITLGLAAALWSASVGFSAIQDTLNIVYKVKESRPYWKARGSAILVSVMLSVIVTTCLAALLGGDFLARFAQLHLLNPIAEMAAAIVARAFAWTIAAGLLILLFAVIYYFAPDVKNKRWHWLSPGAAIGILGWLAASLGLRLYLHYFNQYSLTYGSLGAVIILLLWFYITGLMLLTGAEVNSEIAAAVIEKHLNDTGAGASIHAFPDRAQELGAAGSQ